MSDAITTRLELVVLFQQLYEHTQPECIQKCRLPMSCCSPEYCEMSIEYAQNLWSVKLQRTNHPRLPMMGPTGCTAAPHLRPWCTKHVCCVNTLGYKNNDPKWTDEYFHLTEKIDEVLLVLATNCTREKHDDANF